MHSFIQIISLLTWMSLSIEMDHYQSNNDFKTYTIQKGDHRSINAFEFVSASKFHFEVIFDSSAIYQTIEKANQADINKLYGFSDCFSSHQENSARFGWRWYKGNLELLAYCYVNGERTSKLISKIDLNRSYLCEIDIQDNKYIFRLNDEVREITRACTGSSFGYKLYPYFGGDERAPHNISIKIKDL